MAWLTEDRRNAVVEKGIVYLTDDLKIDIANKYFPRYPTKRAVLLPTLHAVQHHYGWIPTAAMEESAAFLEITPAEVMDTAGSTGRRAVFVYGGADWRTSLANFARRPV